MIDVSVIVLNYNTQFYTQQCIDSILQFTCGLTYEIIIVDNGSEPAFDDSTYKENPKVTILRNEKNIGFSRGNNLGIKHANGEHILLLNSDVVLTENTIKLCFDRLTKDPTIGVITPKILINNKDLQYTACRFPSILLELREFIRINKFTEKSKLADLYLDTAFDHEAETEADWVHGTFFLTRRGLIDKLGGKLPDDLFMYGEDMQWCWKIKKKGYKILYYPVTTIIHYAGASMEPEEENTKYFKKKFPNTFKVVATERSWLYAWLLYFIKAVHLLTLINKKDFQKSIRYFRFLFGEKHYRLNTQ